MNKICPSADEAVADITPGSTILFGGFGGVGVAYSLIHALRRMGMGNLTGVHNHCGDHEAGVAGPIKDGLITKMICAFPGSKQSYRFRQLYDAGKVDLELCAQGTLAERIRAGGAGLGGFFTPTGVDTIVAQGKETRVINGRTYLFEEPIRGDFALIKAHKADTLGNLVYRWTARTFNPDMAMAARVTIAEVDEIVPAGELDPNEIVTPSVFVDRIVKREVPDERELRIIDTAAMLADQNEQAVGLTRAQIAARVAQELRPGMYVNLGVGIPALVSAFVPPDGGIMFHSENGLLGTGPFVPREKADLDLINANRMSVEVVPGASIVSHSTSFAIIRGGHLDVAVLGAYQVSAQGDLANWLLPGRSPAHAGIGGAMDLAEGAKSVFAVMEHTTSKGEFKIVHSVSYPLTARGVVKKIFTNLAVMDVTPDGLLLREVAPGVNVDMVRAATEPALQVASNLREIAVQGGTP